MASGVEINLAVGNALVYKGRRQPARLFVPFAKKRDAPVAIPRGDAIQDQRSLRRQLEFNVEAAQVIHHPRPLHVALVHKTGLFHVHIKGLVPDDGHGRIVVGAVLVDLQVEINAGDFLGLLLFLLRSRAPANPLVGSSRQRATAK